MKMDCLRRFFRALRSLWTSWWQVDRIRASPLPGRLLGLGEGSIVVYRGTSYRIKHREVLGNGIVEYRCRSARSRARLRVEATEGPSTPRLFWMEGCTSSIHEEDLDVYPRPLPPDETRWSSWAPGRE